MNPQPEMAGEVMTGGPSAEALVAALRWLLALEVPSDNSGHTQCAPELR